jgi:hypothetical protein
MKFKEEEFRLAQKSPSAGYAASLFILEETF